MVFVLQLVLTALAAVRAVLFANPFLAVLEINALLVEVGLVHSTYNILDPFLIHSSNRQLLGTVVFTVTSVLGFLLPGLGLLLGGLLGDLGFIISDLGLGLLGGLLGILL